MSQDSVSKRNSQPSSLDCNSIELDGSQTRKEDGTSETTESSANRNSFVAEKPSKPSRIFDSRRFQKLAYMRRAHSMPDDRNDLSDLKLHISEHSSSMIPRKDQSRKPKMRFINKSQSLGNVTKRNEDLLRNDHDGNNPMSQDIAAVTRLSKQERIRSFRKRQGDSKLSEAAIPPQKVLGSKDYFETCELDRSGNHRTHTMISNYSTTMGLGTKSRGLLRRQLQAARARYFFEDGIDGFTVRSKGNQLKAHPSLQKLGSPRALAALAELGRNQTPLTLHHIRPFEAPQGQELPSTRPVASSVDAFDCLKSSQDRRKFYARWVLCSLLLVCLLGKNYEWKLVWFYLRPRVSFVDSNAILMLQAYIEHLRYDEIGTQIPGTEMYFTSTRPLIAFDSEQLELEYEPPSFSPQFQPQLSPSPLFLGFNQPLRSAFDQPNCYLGNATIKDVIRKVLWSTRKYLEELVEGASISMVASSYHG